MVLNNWYKFIEEYLIEEPDDMQVTCPVLKSNFRGGNRDPKIDCNYIPGGKRIMSFLFPGLTVCHPERSEGSSA